MNKSEFLAKLKKFFLYIMPEAAIILGAFIVDIVSKTIVEHTMEIGQSVVLIPKFLNFYYTINKRAAFGSDFGLGNFLGEKGVLAVFIVITLLAVGFFGFLLFKKPKKGLLYRISFSLIIAGALGNLYDRIFCEGVRDFIQFEYFGLEIFGSKTFAIFNIADSCVVVGAIMLVVFFLFVDKSFFERPKKDQGKVEQSDNSEEHIEENSEHGSEENSDNAATEAFKPASVTEESSEQLPENREESSEKVTESKENSEQRTEESDKE